MKKTIYSLLAIAVAGWSLTACSPDEFQGVDPNGVPTVSGEDFTLHVDQDVNQITVNYPEKEGVYPIWIFNGATYSTLNNSGWANTEAGTYTVELKLGNRNGVSATGVKKEFTFNETKVNWDNYFKRITDKEWRIDYAEVAHLACGPYGGDGTGWWSAGPQEKKGFGVYDDRVTFTADNKKGGSFTYNPGADGKTYVNKGCTTWGTQNNEADVDVATQTQVSAYHFERGKWTDSEGQVVDVDFLVLDANTLFPYISADRQYQEPRFRIETLTASKMVLVYENQPDGISWRFILTSKAEEKGFEGFDANSDYNMWKGIDPRMTFYYNPDPNWTNEQTPVLESGFQKGNNDYTVSIPSECYADWQAQVHFHTSLALSAAANYDFSTILLSDQDIDGVIVKLTDENDADFIVEEHVSLKAGEEYICWKSDVPGKDLSPVKLVFDFGHAKANTNVNIRNIVIKDHANDDGTVLPDEGGTSAVNWVAVDSPDNLGAGFNTAGEMQFWWADAGWRQIGDPQFSFDKGVYVITANDATSAEWQAQCSIHNVSLPIEPGQLYDIRAKIESSEDLARYTFKVCDEGDDNNTLVYNGSLALQAGENIVELVGVKCQNNGKDSGFNTAKLFVDLGGCPAGLEIRLSDIIVQRHAEGGTTPSGGNDWDWTSSSNLWKPVYDSQLSPAFYYAPGWSQIADPAFSQDGDVYTVTLPQATTDQWQAQMHFDTSISAKQDDKYNFYCVLESDQDHPGVTVKLTQNGDDNNFFFAPRVALTAFEPYVFKQEGVTLPKGDAAALNLFFDFGGNGAGNTITISKIYLEKVQ